MLFINGRDFAMSAIKILTRIVGYSSLIIMILMPVLYLTGTVELEQTKKFMLVTTVIWFIAAGLWTWKEETAGS